MLDHPVGNAGGGQPRRQRRLQPIVDAQREVSERTGSVAAQLVAIGGIGELEERHALPSARPKNVWQ